MKNRTFYDTDHCYQQLHASVIRLAGFPVTVVGADAGKKKGVFLLKVNEMGDRWDGVSKFVSSDDADVDMTPIPLGMTASNGHAEYLSRMPVRKWKLGLSIQNLKIAKVDSEAEYLYSKQNIIHSQLMLDTVVGNYMAFEEAMKKASRSNKAFAFSRRFAIGNKYNLFYKSFGVPVGIVSKEGPVLTEEFSFLQQVLDEDIK